jgi:hypothetical protein
MLTFDGRIYAEDSCSARGFKDRSSLGRFSRGRVIQPCPEFRLWACPLRSGSPTPTDCTSGLKRCGTPAGVRPPGGWDPVVCAPLSRCSNRPANRFDVFGISRRSPSIRPKSDANDQHSYQQSTQDVKTTPSESFGRLIWASCTPRRPVAETAEGGARYSRNSPRLWFGPPRLRVKNRLRERVGSWLARLRSVVQPEPRGHPHSG